MSQTPSQYNEQLIIEIRAEVGDLKTQMNKVNDILNNSAKQAGLAGQKAGKSFENGFRSTMGAIGAFIYFNFFKDLATDGIRAFADMETAVNKFGIVFGDSAKEMTRWSEEFGASLGMSKQQVMGYAGNVADLFKGFGMGEKQSSDLSKSVLQMTMDLQAFNSTQVKTKEEAMQLVQSGLIGNFEAFNRLGIKVNEATLAQEMNTMGLKGQFSQLDMNNRMLVTYSAMWKQYLAQGAGGYAQNAMQTTAGTLSLMSNKWLEVQQVIGYSVLPVLNAVANVFLNYLAPAIMFVGSVFRSLVSNTVGLTIVGVVLATVLVLLTRCAWVMIAPALMGALAWIKQGIAQLFASACAKLLSMSLLQLFMVVAVGLVLIFALIKAFQALGKAGKASTMDWRKNIFDPSKFKLSPQKPTTGANSPTGKKQVSQEKKLNDKLKDEYDKRVDDYSKVTKVLLGVQRKFITAKDLVIASEQSKVALIQFNSGIAQLEKRIGDSTVGQEFVRQLKSLDPDEYVDYILALNKAGDGELQKIVSNFGTRHTEAMVTAERATLAQKPDMEQALATVGADAGTVGGLALGNALGEELGMSFDDMNAQMPLMLDELDAIMRKYSWQGLMDSLKNAFMSALNWLTEKGKSYSEKYGYDSEVRKYGFNNAPYQTNLNRDGDPNTRWATGGIFTGYSKLGNNIFGEAGHEAVIPLSAKGLRPFAQALAGQMGTGGGVTVQNMYVRNDGDIRKIATELKRIQDADSRNKGYGYGY